MPSTMSKLADDHSEATPPRRYTPKRQKTDPEVKVKITYQKNSNREDHMLHVLMMQAIIAAMEVDIKMVNKRGEALKEQAVADLTNSAFHSNHFNIKYKYTGNRKDRAAKIVIVHRIRGINSERDLKKDKRIMDFLRQHSIHLTKHEWLEEDWDTKTIGFFTQIFPSSMTNEYATKVINRIFSQNASKTSVPHFRIQTIPMRSTTSKTPYNTRVFGLEVKSQDVRSMMQAIKNSIPPGEFISFHLRSVDEAAYHNAIKYVTAKNVNTWTIVVNYVSEGAFFKLEEKIKASLKTDHVIYDPTTCTMKILVPKNSFSTLRNELKSELQNWCIDLDPDDTRRFDTNPEVAYLPRDDYSSSQDSYASRSIASINSLDIEEIDIAQPTSSTTPTTAATQSEVSDLPSNVAESSEVENLRAEVQRYQLELANYTNKMEKLQDVLETILLQVSKLSVPQSNQTETTESQDRRQRYKE